MRHPVSPGPIHSRELTSFACVASFPGAVCVVSTRLAGRIGGEDRAKAIQLSIEYDPRPPFDCGHMSKASAKTKAAATALMARDIAKAAQLKAGTQLLWNHALASARAKAGRR